MKILVADDHPLVRDALVRTVLRADAGASVPGPTTSPARAMSAPRSGPTSRSSISTCPAWARSTACARCMRCIRRWRSSSPRARTIRRRSGRVLAAGARGFFPKSSPSELLLQAIRLVQAGGIYVPPRVLDDVRDGGPPSAPVRTDLTPRQLAVLHRLLRGAPNKTIARELGLTEGTVKIHIAAILRALHARNRTEAVIRARELGLDDGAH